MAKLAAAPVPLPPPGSPEEAALLARRRRGRNLAMLVALVGIALLFYAIAIVKMTKPEIAP